MLFVVSAVYTSNPTNCEPLRWDVLCILLGELIRSWDNLAGIKRRLAMYYRGIRVLFPPEQETSSFPQQTDRLWGPTGLCPVYIECFFSVNLTSLL
jgi:hypothetical protein